VYVALLFRREFVFTPGDHYLQTAEQINRKQYEMARSNRIGLMRRSMQNPDGSTSEVIRDLDKGCVLANLHAVIEDGENGEFALACTDPFLVARISNPDVIERRSQKYPARWTDREATLHVLQANVDRLKITELLGLDMRGKVARRSVELGGDWRAILNDRVMDELLVKLGNRRTLDPATAR
jgi:hypothetical protein